MLQIDSKVIIFDERRKPLFCKNQWLSYTLINISEHYINRRSYFSSMAMGEALRILNQYLHYKKYKMLTYMTKTSVHETTQATQKWPALSNRWPALLTSLHQYYWMRVACVKTEVACVAVLDVGHFGLRSKKLFVNTACTAGKQVGHLHIWNHKKVVNSEILCVTIFQLSPL